MFATRIARNVVLACATTVTITGTALVFGGAGIASAQQAQCGEAACELSVNITDRDANSASGTATTNADVNNGTLVFHFDSGDARAPINFDYEPGQTTATSPFEVDLLDDRGDNVGSAVAQLPGSSEPSPSPSPSESPSESPSPEPSPTQSSSPPSESPAPPPASSPPASPSSTGTAAPPVTQSPVKPAAPKPNKPTNTGSSAGNNSENPAFGTGVDGPGTTQQGAIQRSALSALLVMSVGVLVVWALHIRRRQATNRA